jgi:formate-dependent nitrite reductase cytochrome c552 subunit
MSDIFPRWTNRLPAQVVVGAVLVGSAALAGVWYYFTPKYTRVGYQPVQPVAFSHAIHVDQVGMDCRYCHNAVEKSWYSNIPTAAVCMNCHNQVLRDNPKLELVRESAATGRPIPWVQVHKVPDYVYFNHSVHVNRGVSCVECHSQINLMDEVRHAQPLSMSFCLDCHRNPAAKLRPPDKVTDLNWAWSEDPAKAADLQKLNGPKFVHDWKVESLTSCSACHR